MTAEIDPIELELLARLRVLESITPRIRAEEARVCADGARGIGRALLNASKKRG